MTWERLGELRMYSPEWMRLAEQLTLQGMLERMGAAMPEETTMGSGGPRTTARRAAQPHPGSRLIRERIEPPGASTVADPEDDGDADQGGNGGEGEGDGK